MPHLILAIVSWAVLLTGVKKNRIAQLAISGIIGVVFAVIFDSICISRGLYKYEKMLIPINGTFSVFHFFYIYATTILYLNWLPNSWREQIKYTIFFSTAYFVVEAIMHQFGAIIYLRWQMWYSYPLIIIGLSAVSIVTNKLKLNEPYP